jgi:hypothetical protein
VLVAQAAGPFLKLGGVPVNPYKRAAFDAADRKRVRVDEKRYPGESSFPVAGGSDVILNHNNACKVVDVKEDAGTVSCDLTVDPGKTLSIHLQDPDGRPLTGAMASGVNELGGVVVPLETAACTAYALDPDRPRQLWFLHPGRKLAGVVTVRGDEMEAPTVRLAPTGTVSGRALDRDGRPVAGAYFFPVYSDRSVNALAPHLYRWGLPPRTDKDGRFRLEGVVPGLKFDIGFSKGQGLLIGETKAERRPLTPGAARDLGEVRVKPR